jgi:hypothetical protein
MHTRAHKKYTPQLIQTLPHSPRVFAARSKNNKDVEVGLEEMGVEEILLEQPRDFLMYESDLRNMSRQQPPPPPQQGMRSMGSMSNMGGMPG